MMSGNIYSNSKIDLVCNYDQSGGDKRLVQGNNG